MRLSFTSMSSRAFFLFICAIMCSRAVMPKPNPSFSPITSGPRARRKQRTSYREPVDSSAPDFTIQVPASPVTLTVVNDCTIDPCSTFLAGEAEFGVTGINGFSGPIALDEFVTPIVSEPFAMEASIFPSKVFLDPTAPSASATVSAAAVPTECTITSLNGPARFQRVPFPSVPARVAIEATLVVMCLSLGILLTTGRRAACLVALALFVTGTTMSGCGGAPQPLPPCSFGTPPGDYIVTIVATSGSIMRTATITFVVPEPQQ
jgi:hypothetical protein